MRHTLLGILQTLGTVGAFVLAGVAAAALYPSSMPSSPPRDPAAPASEPGGLSGETWLVDGYNVIQVALLAGRARDEWWGEARRVELLERADALRDASAERPMQVEVVFDGSEPAPPRLEEEHSARAVFAPSADDWILARVAESAPGAAPLIVVTGDRRLANRARHRGARIVTPAAFLALCTS